MTTSATTTATTTRPNTKSKPKPTVSKHKKQYGVCSEWSKPSDSHHLILHLRIQPSERKEKEKEKQQERGAHTGHTPSCPHLLGGAASFGELLEYSPDLDRIPLAYEQHISESYPCRLKTPVVQAQGVLNSEVGPVDAGVLRQDEYDQHTGRRVSQGAQVVTDAIVAKHHATTGVPRAAEDVGTDADAGADTGADAAHTTTTHATTGTPLHCWWCTCSFAWTPYAIPLSRDRDTGNYNTTGSFCTPECCAAYIFGNAHGKHAGGDPWKQYELLHRMVTKVVQEVTVRIKLAPPRETLDKFGGPYSVAKYRRLLNDYRVDVRITMPPVNPLGGVTEEVPVNYVKQRKKFVPIDSSRVEKATNELRLKRKKKHAEENTLETFMQLRIT